MKRLYAFLMVALLAGLSWGGVDATTPIILTQVTTNTALASATTTNTGPIRGQLLMVIVEYDPLVNTNAIDIEIDTVTNDVFKLSGKIASFTNLTASTFRHVRSAVTDSAGTAIAGTAAKIPLSGEKIKVSAFGGIPNGAGTNSPAALDVDLRVILVLEEDD